MTGIDRRIFEFMLDWVKDPADRAGARRELDAIMIALVGDRDFKLEEMRELAEHHLEREQALRQAVMTAAIKGEVPEGFKDDPAVTLAASARRGFDEARQMAGMGGLKCLGCGEAVAKFCARCVVKAVSDGMVPEL